MQPNYKRYIVYLLFQILTTAQTLNLSAIPCRISMDHENKPSHEDGLHTY